MQIIPALSLILLIPALLVVVIIQIFLGVAGDDMPAIGWVHGLVAFVVFVLAGMTGQRATDRTRARTSTAAPA